MSSIGGVSPVLPGECNITPLCDGWAFQFTEESIMSRKIAFIRMEPWPLANKSVAQVLKETFPDFVVEIISVRYLFENRIDIISSNILFLIKEYGIDILLGRKNNLRTCFLRTPYIFKTMKKLVSSHLAKNKYAFSFQMQSLFDASTEGLPHFVYTDNTCLAHLYYPHFDRRKLYSKSWIELERTIYQNATINFTRSSNVTRSIIEQYSCRPEKVVCVYAGSNAKVNHTAIGNRDYEGKNVLFVGMDWRRKGGPELVEAFKAVLKVHPDAKLTIVGCSPRLDVPNCTVVGRVPLEEVNRYYERSSVFCLPTRREPFGIAFIEALTYKLPVVATNIAAIPDFILDGENGYLVSPNNVEQLAEALIDLVGNPRKCQIFGEKGYRIATERYSWEKVGAKIRENIESVVDL